MKTVVQLIPYDGIGGVETAARSVPAHWGGVRFVRAYLVRKTPVQVFADDWHGPKASENSLRAQLELMGFAWRSRPDLVIGSLWRALPTLIMLQWLRPRAKSVLFVHNDCDAHAFDWFLNRLAMWRATQIWADSAASLAKRVPARWHGKSQVLSFLTVDLDLGERADSPPLPDFVFWGRLHRQKNLLRALDLFAAIYRRRTDARFRIFGPDGGDEQPIRARIVELGLGEAVMIAGPRDQAALFAEARTASFYLQTSVHEGMAMSVSEAMSLGLVPVVTPVGEIGTYADDGETAIFVHDVEQASERVLALMEDPHRYAEMSKAARATWARKSLYREDFAAACSALLAKES